METEKPLHRIGQGSPHAPHLVVKMKSTNIEVGQVFDASIKISSGISLNERLHRGPKLQDDVATIILRQSKYKHAFSSDMEKNSGIND